MVDGLSQVRSEVCMARVIILGGACAAGLVLAKLAAVWLFWCAVPPQDAVAMFRHGDAIANALLERTRGGGSLTSGLAVRVCAGSAGARVAWPTICASRDRPAGSTRPLKRGARDRTQGRGARRERVGTLAVWATGGGVALEAARAVRTRAPCTFRCARAPCG